MRKIFENIIIVDWSAASKPATGADSIWLGVYRRDVRLQMRFESYNPATRHEARQIIDGLLAEFRRRGDRTLIGFDFPLGYPVGTASALNLTGTENGAWSAMHQFLAREVKDKPTNANNRFAVAAMMNRRISGEAFPFWGCPAKDVLTTLQAKKTRPHGDGDVAERRRVESLVKSTSPVWKLYTIGSVGSQALTGIPFVHALRQANPTARIWPFETGFAPASPAMFDGADLVLAEIYPSLVPVSPQAGETKDLAQVRTLGRHFADADEKGELATLFGPRGNAQEALSEQVVAEEGWILGV